MKKLVKLDPISKCHTEIDTVKLERLSKELLDFIKTNIDKSNDIHGIWKSILPLCEKVLNHTLSLPLPYSELPLKYAAREGLLSEDFEELYSAFSM